MRKEIGDRVSDLEQPALGSFAGPAGKERALGEQVAPLYRGRFVGVSVRRASLKRTRRSPPFRGCHTPKSVRVPPSFGTAAHTLCAGAIKTVLFQARYTPISDSKVVLNRRNALLAGTTLAGLSALSSPEIIQLAQAQASALSAGTLPVFTDQEAHAIGVDAYL